MKRLFILLICIMLLLCGCDAQLTTQNVLGAYGTTSQEQQSTSPELTDVTMLYYSDMDTNPVTTDCLANHELLKFVYSPMITINAGFEPICILAENWKMEKNTITIKLRSDIFFSNGEPVSAYDVVKSFNVAKSSVTSPYHHSTTLMQRYYASDSKTFVCVFRNTDIDCLALLDIPIMYDGKEGSGCGAYVFSEQNGKAVLTPNERYFEKASVSVIRLVETKDDSYIDDLFSSGALDIMIASAVEELSLTSLRDYQITACPSNRFVYIGVNFANEHFSKIEVRKALSTIIDRTKIAEQSLVGLASAAHYPFSPEWYRMKSVETAVQTRTEKDVINAIGVLKDIPLTLVVPDSNYKLSLANEIAACFKDAGLTLEIKSLESEKYTAAITSGQYDLYLGEVALPRNMDPTDLYKTGGTLNYSGFADSELDNSFLSYKRGEITLRDYLAEFDKKMPLIPVLFSKNVLYCAQGIAGFADRSAYNIYGNSARITLK